MQERRLSTPGKPASLPRDLTKMIEEILTTNFQEGIEELANLEPEECAEPKFTVEGNIYPDEIILSICLSFKGRLNATTVHASCDFDPKANLPTAEQLIHACVDGAGGLFATLLDADKPERLKALSSGALASLEDVPYDWSGTRVGKVAVFIKVDKSHVELERAAEEFLNKHPLPEEPEETYEESSGEEQGEDKDQVGDGPTFH